MSGKKILVADDEAVLVKMIRLRLEANGFVVLTAADGEDALDKAQRERPDLIILDLMLPKMDGYQVCASLKSDPGCRSVPIVILSARAQDTDKKMGEEAGASAYITKPFDTKELLAKIHELLDTKEKNG